MNQTGKSKPIIYVIFITRLLPLNEKNLIYWIRRSFYPCIPCFQMLILMNIIKKNSSFTLISKAFFVFENLLLKFNIYC